MTTNDKLKINKKIKTPRESAILALTVEGKTNRGKNSYKDYLIESKSRIPVNSKELRVFNAKCALEEVRKWKCCECGAECMDSFDEEIV